MGIISVILVWSIAAYGMSNILVYGSIFEWLRSFFRKISNSRIKIVSLVGEFFTDMLGCMMCTGFHVGWILSLLIFFSPSFFVGTNFLVSLFFDACYSSGVVWVINSIVEWFEENRPKEQDTGDVSIPCIKYRVLSPGNVTYLDCSGSNTPITQSVKFNDTFCAREVLNGMIEFQEEGYCDKPQMLND